MDIALPARTVTTIACSSVKERGLTDHRAPGLFTAMARSAFVVAAEIALVLLLATQ